MATISSIGTASRNYSSVAAWVAAFASGGWIGECYNDTEFMLATGVALNPATSVSDFLTLRCAAGQSFKDNPGPLKYDQSRGVGFTTNANYTQMFTLAADYITINGIQCLAAFYANSCLNQYHTGGPGGPHYENTFVSQCIFDVAPATLANAINQLHDGLYFNNLCVYGQNTTAVTTSYISNLVLASCTFVLPSDLGPAGYWASSFGSSSGYYDCAFFGFAACVDTPANFFGSNNGSDITATFGSSNQDNKTYANQFIANTSISKDFRLKAGSNMIDTGRDMVAFLGDPRVTATDIFGNPRPVGAAWDIGCYEYFVPAYPYVLLAQSIF